MGSYRQSFLYDMPQELRETLLHRRADDGQGELHPFGGHMGLLGKETFFGHVERIDDIIILLQACSKKILQPVRQRLSSFERSQIRSGSIFVWEQNSTGLQRWTDGFCWTTSRMCRHFQIYKEDSQSGQRQERSKDSFYKKIITIKSVNQEQFRVVSYYRNSDVRSGFLRGVSHCRSLMQLDSELGCFSIPDAFPAIVLGRYIIDTPYQNSALNAQSLARSQNRASDSSQYSPLTGAERTLQRERTRSESDSKSLEYAETFSGQANLPIAEDYSEKYRVQQSFSQLKDFEPGRENEKVWNGQQNCTAAPRRNVNVGNLFAASEKKSPELRIDTQLRHNGSSRKNRSISSPGMGGFLRYRTEQAEHESEKNREPSAVAEVERKVGSNSAFVSLMRVERQKFNHYMPYFRAESSSNQILSDLEQRRKLRTFNSTQSLHTNSHSSEKSAPLGLKMQKGLIRQQHGALESTEVSAAHSETHFKNQKPSHAIQVESQLGNQFARTNIQRVLDSSARLENPRADSHCRPECNSENSNADVRKSPFHERRVILPYPFVKIALKQETRNLIDAGFIRDLDAHAFRCKKF